MAGEAGKAAFLQSHGYLFFRALKPIDTGLQSTGSKAIFFTKVVDFLF
jgi:hypothetical protein